MSTSSPDRKRNVSIYTIPHARVEQKKVRTCGRLPNEQTVITKSTAMYSYSNEVQVRTTRTRNKKVPTKKRRTLRITSKTTFPAPALKKLNASELGLVAEDTSYWKHQ